MNDPDTTPVSEEDAAWASFTTDLDPGRLMSFCEDIERLFRINPMLQFTRWEQLGEDRYAFAGRNISQEPAFGFDLELQVEKRTDGYRIDYTGSVKNSTTIRIEAAGEGSKLILVDSYDGMPETERQSRLAEVDRSLSVWAMCLQKFLARWQRWSRIGIWRWYMRRVWQPMSPSGRRITHMLLVISAFEVALILLGVAIYFAEYA